LPIRLRLALWQSAIFGVALGLFGVAVYWLMASRLEDMVEEMVTLHADHLVAAVNAADHHGAGLTIPPLDSFESPEVYVQVLDAGGAVLARRIQPRRGPAGPEGRHEFTIVVQGRYRPERVVVTQGDRVRLRFRRLEDDPCSEWVVFSGIGLERRLPAFQETLVEFVPTVPGEQLFTCQWGTYRGKLLVKPWWTRR
jgi:hypothetical protein